MADKFEHDAGTITRVKPERKLKRPRLFRVLVHNDDYTTREFVVAVLHSVFHLDEQSAIRIMMHVHSSGVGVAGVYTRELAESKIGLVERLAREEECPLRLSMEPDGDES